MTYFHPSFSSLLDGKGKLYTLKFEEEAKPRQGEGGGDVNKRVLIWG